MSDLQDQSGFVVTVKESFAVSLNEDVQNRILCIVMEDLDCSLAEYLN